MNTITNKQEIIELLNMHTTRMRNFRTAIVDLGEKFMDDQKRWEESRKLIADNLVNEIHDHEKMLRNIDIVLEMNMGKELEHLQASCNLLEAFSVNLKDYVQLRLDYNVGLLEMSAKLKKSMGNCGK